MTPSDYEMIEQGYDPPRMTEPSVEEIVERLEKFTSMFVSGSMAAPLIASWRERGEALKEARPYVQGTFDQLKMTGSAYIPKAVLDKIDAALKDKP